MRIDTIVLSVIVLAAAPASGALGQSARVLVNQRELRAEFPRDTAHEWHWPESTNPRDPDEYAWRVMVNSVGGTRTLSLDVDARAARRDFRSLAKLVAAGQLWLCHLDFRRRCGAPVAASATVERSRVVLRLRDSTAIATMFALRPATVLLQQDRPGERGRGAPMAIAVTYTTPMIPPPTAAVLAAEEQARTPYGPPRWGWRSISGGQWRGDTLSLKLGDSVTLHTQNSDCYHDLCMSTEFLTGGTWSVADTTILDVAISSADSSRVAASAPSSRARVTARRTGRTTLRVTLSVPIRENIPGADPAKTTLEVPVLVVP